MNPQLLSIDLENATKFGGYDESQITQTFIKGYMQIVKDWGLTDPEAEKMLAVDHQTWMQIRRGTWNGLLDQENLTRIGEITAIYDALHSFLGEEEGNRWVTKPNKLSMFSGRRPVDAIIQEGRPMMKRTQRLTRGILAGM